MQRETICAACGHGNFTSERSCASCGASLLRTCPSCSARAPPRALFCAQCGQRLDESIQGPRTEREAESSGASGSTHDALERRQVTVQFCDLCDSTVLSETLDPEDLRRVLRVFQDACAPVLQRYGGYISRYMGDGILTLFGYPRARDDAAYGAVRSALDIVAHFATERIRLDARPVDVSVRVGIATGMVVAGDLIGMDHAREEPVVGRTPNLAARLQSVAGTDEVVISELTHRLVAHRVRCRALEPLSLKGIREPVRAYRALGTRRTGRGADRGVAAARGTRFVNRLDELTYLLALWSEVRAGAIRAVLIRGEPGIGKSRLRRELLRRIADEHAFCLHLQCSADRSNSPLHPLLDLVEDIDPLREALRRRYDADTAATLDTHVAALTEAVLGSLSSDAAPRRPTSAGRRSPAERFVELVSALAVSRPVVLFLEDAHWADPSTLRLFEQLLSSLQNERVLVLLLARPGFRFDGPPSLPCRSVRLKRLSHRDVRDIVEAHVGPRTLTPTLLNALVDRSDGVPLFAEELSNSYLDFRFDAPRNGVDPDADGRSDFAVPDTLRDLLMMRLDSLGDARHVAQLASVIGREFALETLRELAGLREESLRSRLAELLASGLVLEARDSAEHAFYFKHSLIQDTAYDSLTNAVRLRLHRRVAELLERRLETSARSRPELVAWHFGASGEASKAAHYWNLASGKALQQSANVEALHHARSGIAFLPAIDDGAERDRLSLALHVYLCSAIAGTRGDADPELESIHRVAAGLLERVDDDGLRFALTREMHAYHLIRGPVSKACELARQLLSLAESHGKPQNVTDSLRVLGWTYFCHGQLAEGRDLLKRSIDSYQRTDSRIHTEHDTIDPGAVGTINLAWAEWLLGDEASARELIRRAIRLSRDIEHPYSLAYCLCLGGAVRQCQGDAEGVLELIEQALVVARKRGYRYWIAWGNAMRGWALARLGDEREGLRCLEAGHDDYRTSGATLFVPHILCLRADTLLRGGRFAEADGCLREARRVEENNGIRFHSVETLRLSALAATATNEPAAAARALAEAERTARRQGALGFARRLPDGASLSDY